MSHKAHGAPLTPPYVRVTYTAVHQALTSRSLHQLVLSTTFKIRLPQGSLSNFRFTRCSVLHQPVRTPPLSFKVAAHVPLTTMTSADFLAHRKRIYSKISPGKGLFFHPIPATSTKKGLLATSFAKVCLLTLPIWPPYAVPVRRYRILQSRFLQCIPHGKPPCDLLQASPTCLSGTCTL